MRTFLFGFTILSSAWAVQPDFSNETFAVQEEKRDLSFNYLSLGLTGTFLNPNEVMGFDPFIGHRHFFTPHQALDCGVGAWFASGNLYYMQTSYLYYPWASRGPYLGAGITAGALVDQNVGWFNVPLTFGYQFRTQKSYSSFVQIQVSPITTPSLETATLSFGFGF